MVDSPSLVDLRLAFFYPFDVFFVVLNLSVILPKSIGVLLDLIYRFSVQLVVHVAIVPSKKLAHFNEIEEVTLVPLWEAVIHQIFEGFRVLLCVLRRRFLAIFGPFFGVSFVFFPKVFLGFQLIKLRVVQELVIETTNLLFPASLRFRFLGCIIFFRWRSRLDLYVRILLSASLGQIGIAIPPRLILLFRHD